MANLLEYDIRVIGRRALEAEFATIERRIATHNQQVARITGATVGRARSGSTGSGVAAEARAAAAVSRQQVREQLAAARAAARAEIVEKRRVAKETAAIQREEQRHHEYWRRTRQRGMELQHQQEQRQSRQRLMLARREARDRVQFVQDTIGNAGNRVGRIASAVGTAGLATVGIGGTMLAAGAISQATKLDEGARRLAIQGRDPGQTGLNPDDVRRRFMQVGIARGIAPEQIMAGAASYTAETGDVNAAMANLDTFATVAQASGASIEEIATAAAHLRKLGITSVDDMRQSLASLTMQGKKGSFEIKNMASEFPEVTAQAASFGIRGVKGLQQLGGIMQVAKTAAGSGPEASTAVQTMFRQLAAKSTDIQTGEAFEGRKVNVFEGGDTKGKLRDFREVLGDILVASRGDLPQLQHVFDVRGMKAVNPLIERFRDVREKALAGGKSEKEAGQLGRDAALQVLDNAANVPGAYSELQRDATDAMKSWGVQLTVLEAQLKGVISEQVFPELVRLGPSLKELIPAVRTATRGFVAVAKFFAENPLTGIGAIIAAQIAMDVGKAKLGALFTKLIERVFGGVRSAGGIGAATGGGGGGATGPTVSGWGRNGRGAGSFLGRPGWGAAGAAMGMGVMIGAPIAAATYANGIADFESSEDRMRSSGQDLNSVRTASVGDIDAVKSRIAESRRRVAKLKRTSFLDDIGEWAWDTFGTEGAGPSQRKVELNTEQGMLAEMERKLKTLENQKELEGGTGEQAKGGAAPALKSVSDSATDASTGLKEFSKQVANTAAELGKLRNGADQPPRGNAPSATKG